MLTRILFVTVLVAATPGICGEMCIKYQCETEPSTLRGPVVFFSTAFPDYQSVAALGGIYSSCRCTEKTAMPSAAEIGAAVSAVVTNDISKATGDKLAAALAALQKAHADTEAANANMIAELVRKQEETNKVLIELLKQRADARQSAPPQRVPRRLRRLR